MLQILILFAALAVSVFAAPTPGEWVQRDGWYPPGCTEETMQTRQDFNRMAPADRKAYTDAVRCLMDQPSQLDPVAYPGAINRFFDYAAIHINRTKTVHLDGFFLPWHRMFLHLYEQDLKNICGYPGTLPYWNWPATADDLQNSPIFNGDEYSMSGDGIYIDSGPLHLSPTFSLPKGSGGGCVTTGPFAGMNYTMQDIPITIILEGEDLPATAWDYNASCLTRDLNTFVATTQTNWDLLNAAIAAPDMVNFTAQLNGVIGGSTLGLHSGAHFTMGTPASSLFVSPQDPIWYPLHTMLDNVWVLWQMAHSEISDQLSGTETAVNLPPSANVTLETMTPDFGYLWGSVPVSYLMDTTKGPFCYRYDWQDGPYTE